MKILDSGNMECKDKSTDFKSEYEGRKYCFSAYSIKNLKRLLGSLELWSGV